MSVSRGRVNSGVYREGPFLRGYDAASLGNQFPTFRRILPYLRGCG